jgi:salicylate hydroxylase
MSGVARAAARLAHKETRMASRKPHILIIGGGIGGMAAALALLKRGFDVDVYEQSAELREVGAGIQISPNGNRALDALGVFETLRELSSKAESKEVRLWNTGRTWKTFDLGAEAVQRYGFPYLTVYRPDLLTVLADAVRREKADAIHLGARCVEVREAGETVSATFEDGRQASGDALIGADGVHSMIRTALFGGGPSKFLGMSVWRGLIPMDRLPAKMKRSVAAAWLGPKGHVVHYPLRNGEMLNFVATVEHEDWTFESWSVEGANGDCAADFAGWHSEIQAMIANAPRLIRWALVGRPFLPHWTKGRISLLGDACHPTLQLLAQGAVMAIEDAVILGRCFEEYADVHTALTHYENARSDITRRKVQGAADNVARFHNPAFNDEQDAETFIAREWGREAILDRYEWMFTYDVATTAV